MKKINTLFKKDPNNLSRVINEVNPENQWVLDGEGIATRKWDGTACAIIDGLLYKRYDVKKGRTVPENAIPCQEPDEITGHWPHWVKIDMNDPQDRYFTEAWKGSLLEEQQGWRASSRVETYELIGPKINGNKELRDRHELVKHGDVAADGEMELSFEGLRQYLNSHDIEGIVFHHPDGRMAKIRKSDFGIKR